MVSVINVGVGGKIMKFGKLNLDFEFGKGLGPVVTEFYHPKLFSKKP